MKATSPLDRLSGPGKPLREEAPDAKEFAGLVRSGLARLADAKNTEISMESRFDVAYSAAHALGLAALRRMGYRASNRYIVFQALPHTLGLGPEVWKVLAKCHAVHNRVEYGGGPEIGEQLPKDLIIACESVAAALEK
ncbi:MAG TPA: hypothetical protein VHB46_21180 [Burkholderiales bacterium]|nr:hypothetical protein [Burkholderiales bacterium]